MVNYPLKRVINFAKVLNKALKETHEDPSEIINTFVNLSKKARTDGLLALEEDVKNIKNDFLKRGVQLVIDGVDADFIRNLMETELTFIRERHKVGQEMFFALGTYNPAWGIIGTVIGLILMLRRLEDPSMIGIGMAVALLTTLYGLIGGYLIWNPIGGKLRRKSEEEIFVKEVIIRGVMLLQAGAAPRLIESNLKAYLEPKMRQVGVPKK
jgi:chemotaxis protein MotA